MNTKQASNAFSLIELIVVIAIIGVLAGISVGTYKNYVAKSNAAELVNIVNAYKDRSILFAQQNGYFPSPSELGLDATGNNVTDPSTLLPAAYASGDNVFGFYDDSVDIGFDRPCGAHMVMQLVVDAYAAGFPQVSAPDQGMLSLLIYLYNVNNVVTALNIYYIYDGQNMLNDDFISGWVNYSDPQVWDINTELRSKATCQ